MKGKKGKEEEKKRQKKKKVGKKVPMRQSNPRPLNLQPSLPLLLPPQGLIANCTYVLYIANFDFDDLTVAALATPNIISNLNFHDLNVALLPTLA